jgi:hypothetical protein
MSDQEMQFADPDWKPSQQLDTNTRQQEQEANTPQPINSGYREQNKWDQPPSPFSQQEGYTGLRPYAGPVPGQIQGGNFRQRPYSRRGRGPWFWIILAFIIFSLISGGSRFGGGFGDGRGPGFDRNPVEQKQIEVKPIVYTVSGQATLVISDPNGNVTVTQGQSNTDVTIRPVNGINPFSNPNNVPFTSSQSQDGKTIDVNAQDSGQGPVDLNVVVPQNTILQLKTDSGNINVNSVEGQMTLITNTGNINTTNDVLSGTNTLSTQSGDINFDGTIRTGGNYQFNTTSGTVTVALPTSPAFHVVATTNSGSIKIPGVANNSSGTQATGDVGANSQVKGTDVTVKSDSGDITLNLK